MNNVIDKILQLITKINLLKYRNMLFRHKIVYNLFDYFPFIVLVMIYCFFQLQIINLDFWNDEIYTLKHFVFTSFATTITDYHVPNNHIFFNLINNIYLRIIGIDDLYLLMDNPFILRIIPFVYSLITLFVTYLIGKKFFNKKIAILSVLVMITTIPYYNSATQIRGYGLSTLLIIGIIYSCFNYFKNNKKYSLFITGILTTLLFYTIPTNILFILGLFCFYSSMVLIELIFTKKIHSVKSLFKNPSFNLVLIILVGIVVSLVLYIPIIKVVFSNEYVDSNKHFNLTSIILLPRILMAFLSNRLLLGAVFIFGLISSYEYYKKWITEIVFFGTVILVSFIINCIHGGDTPTRIFTIFVPLFCILLSLGICTFIHWFTKSGIISYLIIILLLIYSIVVFSFELKKYDARILLDIKTENRSQHIYYNYYIPYYEPQKILREFKNNYYSDSSIVVLHLCEPHDLPIYLDKYDIIYYDFSLLDSLLKSNDIVFILSNHPNMLINSNYHTLLLNDNYSYLNIVKCIKN